MRRKGPSNQVSPSDSSFSALHPDIPPSNPPETLITNNEVHFLSQSDVCQNRVGTSRIHSLSDVHAVFIYIERSCWLLDQYPHSFLINALVYSCHMGKAWLQLELISQFQTSHHSFPVHSWRDQRKEDITVCPLNCFHKVDYTYLTVVMVVVIFFLSWHASRSSLESRYLEGLIHVPSFWDLLFWKRRHRQYP